MKDKNFHRESATHKKSFTTHMGKINIQIEAHQKEIETTHKDAVHHAMDADTREAYMCWRLQQTNPSLTPILVPDIPTKIRKNIKEKRGLFDGMLRPWPVGESSTGNEKGKAPMNEGAQKKAWQPRKGGDSDE
ncbi:hypothetical protein PIB30_058881 [Stylosanthes scabra]|uniref:Uncharacterized protein n=1 Tax=Stylosanthes scabra TaxID=79078 RepID=A0ABU6WKL7_9FABA|nr:hypothetical protein [Stylosanthes scabra]